MPRLMLLAVIVAACVAGAGSAASGGYIYLKARAAQFLIARAWDHNDFAGRVLRPWPWADTQVLARLRVPALSVEQYVLEGAHGQALAFGPGHLSGTPQPGDPGNSVVAGHRDTQFRFLRDLRIGDEIWFDLPQGRTVRYRVRSLRVTTDMDPGPLAQRADTWLTLITCYPFDALRAGGPLRFIVEAQA